MTATTTKQDHERTVKPVIAEAAAQQVVQIADIRLVDAIGAQKILQRMSPGAARNLLRREGFPGQLIGRTRYWNEADVIEVGKRRPVPHTRAV